MSFMNYLVPMQKLPMTVSIERDGKWEYVDYFNIAGGIAFREDVLKIDLPETGMEKLRLKLEYGTYFWELDHTALDVSPADETITEITKSDQLAGKNFEVNRMKLQSAINQDGQDLREKLLADDALYYVQPEIGDRADLVFMIPSGNAGNVPGGLWRDDLGRAAGRLAPDGNTRIPGKRFLQPGILELLRYTPWV